jgi:hypothetical protein
MVRRREEHTTINTTETFGARSCEKLESKMCASFAVDTDNKLLVFRQIHCPTPTRAKFGVNAIRIVET